MAELAVLIAHQIIHAILLYIIEEHQRVMSHDSETVLMHHSHDEDIERLLVHLLDELWHHQAITLGSKRLDILRLLGVGKNVGQCSLSVHIFILMIADDVLEDGSVKALPTDIDHRADLKIGLAAANDTIDDLLAVSAASVSQQLIHDLQECLGA